MFKFSEKSSKSQFAFKHAGSHLKTKVGIATGYSLNVVKNLSTRNYSVSNKYKFKTYYKITCMNINCKLT